MTTKEINNIMDNIFEDENLCLVRGLLEEHNNRETTIEEIKVFGVEDLFIKLEHKGKIYSGCLTEGALK